LTGSLTANADYWWNERTNDDSISTSPTDGASVTFTPTAGNYLVMTYAQVSHGDTTTGYISGMTRSGEASSSTPESRCEGGTSGTYYLGYLMARGFACTAVSNTFKEVGTATSGSAHTRTHSSIFVLRLGAFETSGFSYTDGDVSLSATDFATNLETLNVTPATTGDFVIGGYWGYDCANLSRTALFRLQAAGTDSPGTQTSDVRIFRAKDNTDERPLSIVTVTSLTSGASRALTLDGSVSSTTSTPAGQHRSVWAFSAELGVANTGPTITPNTADATTFTTTTPTLEFTGDDPDSDDLRYEVQITDNPDAFASGSELEATFPSGGGGLSVHPQYGGGTAWDTYPLIDDRPGMSFPAHGGKMHKMGWFLGNDQGNGSYPDATAVVRIYLDAGTYGTTSAPPNPPADEDDTPTPDWIAESDPLTFTSAMSSTPAFYDFTFSGANLIHLTPGVKYMGILSWRPNDTNSQNTVSVAGDAINSGSLYAGNAYMDGNNSNPALRGVQATWDFYFRVYETYTLLTKVSGTDSGFANTVSGGDTDPFTDNQKVSFTVQGGDALADGGVYYWRARVKDPSGTDNYSSYTTTRSFTIDLASTFQAAYALAAIASNQ
jgi:hypothetical protein